MAVLIVNFSVPPEHTPSSGAGPWFFTRYVQMAPDLTSTSSTVTPPTTVSPARTTSSNTTTAQPLPHSRSDSRSATSSRRPSQPAVTASGNHSQTSPLPSPSLTRAMPPETVTSGIGHARGSENGAGVHGPGPIRHPRPLSPAEMYSQLEQEQEAVVGSRCSARETTRDFCSRACRSTA